MPTGVIGHINLARGFRGGERQTELLIRGLKERGYRQRLICRRSEDLHQKLADLDDLEILPVNGLLAAARALGGLQLIHVHQGRSAQPAAVAGALHRIPYVITRRIAVSPGQDFWTRWCYRHAARAVGVCQAAADAMRDHIADERLAVVFSAASDLTVDEESVAKIRSRFPGKFIVGCIGALDQRQKGQAYLIEAARRFAVTEPDLVFVFLGSGPDEDRFRKDAANLSNVFFEGFRSNVGDYLSAMDLFAMPSLMEGIGGILIDAMNFGLPAVASRVDGLPEVMLDGETGLLVPPADVDALHAAILELYRDPPRRQAMAAAAKRRASLFSVESMVKGYQQIYADVLSGAAK